MKKTLLIILIIVAMCLLSACNFTGGITPTTTTQATTTAPSEDALPTLDALTEAMQATAPRRMKATVTTEHAGLGTLETACYLLVGEGGSYYYYYTSEYFLPLTEAIAAQDARGVRTGYLLTEGGTIKASAPTIDHALIEELQSYAIRRINLREDLLEGYEIKRVGDTVVLTALVDDNTASLVFDEHLNGAGAIALTVTFAADTLLPLSYTVTLTAADGTPARYDALYSYVAATLPTVTTAPTPDLSLWE